MKPVFWKPAADIFRVQDEMNRMFDNFLGRDTNDRDLMSGAWAPAVDVLETEDNFELKAELPGLSKDDVKVTLHENVLTIKGEKKEEVEDKKCSYHRIERSHGAFSRSFVLPSRVQNDKIKADYKDGVLTLVVPKVPESKPREIEIKI
jgi:HSP20 family protein